MLPVKSNNLKPRFMLTALLVMCIATAACESEAQREAKAKDAAYRERYAKAEALFRERCKTAGVVIHRTVKDVEGIELTKVRPKLDWADRRYFDPMFEGAAMAGEHQGVDYVNQFLMTELIDARQPQRRGTLNSPDFESGAGQTRRRGYQFVEVIDQASGQRARAEFDKHPPGTNLWVKAPRLTPVTESVTRYALDYDDLVNANDRLLWVAGTQLKVVDKQTGEVIATLTKFVWDPGFGSRSTGRWPWQHADNFGPSRNCPSEPGVASDTSRKFVDTVLIPKQEY